MDKRTAFVLLFSMSVVVASARYVTAGNADFTKGPIRRWPAADRLETLGAYLSPPQGSRPIIPETALSPDDFADYEPVYEPEVVAGDPPAEAVAPPQPSWRVSAILVADNRRVAIVNDSAVAVGDPLPGGARVIEIELDFVVLRAADGARTVLRL